MFGRRVVRPWLGLKMIDLNDMIISQLKERDSSFPSIKRGILVPIVCILVVSSLLFIITRGKVPRIEFVLELELG